jgi:hypothetical protein
MSYNRRIIGSIVHAKAIHATNEAECGRCSYGRDKLTKLIQGHVTKVHNGQSRTGRSQCSLTPVTLIWGGAFEKEKAQHPVHKIGSASVGCEFGYSGPNPKNSEFNTVDAIEAAATNSNNAGKNTPAAPLNSPPALSNSPPAPLNPTYDGSVSLLMPTVGGVATTATPVGTTHSQWGGLKMEEAQHPVHQIGSASGGCSPKISKILKATLLMLLRLLPAI